MKHLLLILSLCLAACSTTPPPEPPPQPTNVLYVITALDDNGQDLESYITRSYTAQKFPSKVTFKTGQGREITIHGSFRIIREPQP